MPFILALLFLLVGIHPFTSYPASLYLLKRLKYRKPINPTPSGYLVPSVCFCVAAYNEEAVIVDKVENLLRLARTVPSCEISIYVDAATDRTAALLEPYLDRVDVIVGQTRQGKSRGLETLIARAKADILVFTDANVMLDDRALVAICSRFADPEVGCVAGHLRYQNGSETSTAAVGNVYWRVEEAIHQLESDTVGIVGVDGSLFATRRIMHKVAPPDLVDDFYVSMQVLIEGHKVIRASDAWAFERLVTDEREEFARKVRIACRAFNVHRFIWPQVWRSSPGILYAYVSHKLLKWFMGYNLAVAGLLCLFGAFTTLPPVPLAFALVVVAFLTALLWRLEVSAVRKIVSVAAAFSGTALGIAKSIRGEKFQTWSPLKTAREPQG